MLEKEATEKQMAGGFAHEIRNALVGSKLVIEKALGYDRPGDHVSLMLENSRRLKEAFLYLKERLTENDLDQVLDVMKKNFINEEQLEEIMGVIHKSVNRGLSIAQQIMDYSRLGHETIDKKPVNIDHLILKFVEENQSAFAAQGIAIKHTLNSGNIKISGREDHFISIFSNLIFNSRDALLDNSLPDNHLREIVITSTQNDTYYQVKIKDNGVGIPSENLTRIFDAFFSTKPETGTGLGLGVVKKLISLYKGEIKLESEVGKGTTVIVNLLISPHSYQKNRV
jgi:signal transduction histidine kinase